MASNLVQQKTIRKVLIANRGEIACRIMRTLHRQGIGSVAIYSEADATSLHVSMADQAVCVGPAAASESYLRMDVLIQAAKDFGVDAIHPGYGFLSENPAFVRACDQAGLIFIGPSADAIAAMGLKDAARKLMQDAGVSVVPGYHGNNQDADFLSSQADEIGYPVLIKARAGGGGKGMRKVDRTEDFNAALESARREAAASFNDDRVLIEKYVTAPRHIEVQVIGDQHGNLVHLFERDCSLQRRHQKVIEEAPAPGMTEAMREAMGYAAIQAARAVGYYNAGTVEFIVDASEGLKPDRFYFMEMNTRLQVEHPVTEMITGIDLVAWQLDVARGKPLALDQQNIVLNGHAMEARIYAEDTDAGFLPSTGTLRRFRLDQQARIDTGVSQGDEISPFYDPMIAKVIVHADDRDATAASLCRALGNCQIAGCTTNIDFLGRLCQLPRFLNGDVTTGLINEESAALMAPARCDNTALIVAALLESGCFPDDSPAHDPWYCLLHWRSWDRPVHNLVMQHRDDNYTVSIAMPSDGSASTQLTASIADARYQVDIQQQNNNSCVISIDGETVRADWYRNDHAIDIFTGNNQWHLQFEDALQASNVDGNFNVQVLAPMPGSIIRIDCAEGSTVSQGDALIVMEAMKMEHTLSASHDSVVDTINVAIGDQVDTGAILVVFKN